MNNLAWPEDPTIEDVPDRLVEIVRESDGNVGMVANELFHALHGDGTVHVIEDGSVRYIGPEHPNEEWTIIQMAYHNDARRIVEIVQEAE